MRAWALLALLGSAWAATLRLKAQPVFAGEIVEICYNLSAAEATVWRAINVYQASNDAVYSNGLTKLSAPATHVNNPHMYTSAGIPANATAAAERCILARISPSLPVGSSNYIALSPAVNGVASTSVRTNVFGIHKITLTLVSQTLIPDLVEVKVAFSFSSGAPLVASNSVRLTLAQNYANWADPPRAKVGNVSSGTVTLLYASRRTDRLRLSAVFHYNARIPGTASMDHFISVLP